VRFFSVLSLLIVGGSLGAQRPRQRPAASAPPAALVVADTTPGSELTIDLMTFGVGEQIWEKFGHNAIRIRDARTGTDSIYHWGLFDFRQPNFIGRFLKGQMLYSMGGFTLQSTMTDYYYFDRSVWTQQLDLTNAQKVELRRLIAENMQPGHREYFYNYYTDNCSTRVRDILDRVLGGVLRAGAIDSLTGHTYRWHTLRLTQDGFPITTGMHIGLGRPADRPMTAWQEFFLPQRLHDYVRQVRLPNSAGGSTALVRSEDTLYTSRKFTEPMAAPRWAGRYALIGCVIAALLLALGIAGTRRQGGLTILAGAVHGLVAFAIGVVGLLLTLLWTVTHHTFAHANENLLIFNPLWLILAVAAPFTLARGHAAWSRRLALLCAGIALVAPLLHVVGLSRQSNLDLFGLVLPPIVAFAFVMYRAAGRKQIT
jgi:hypothetical protein